MPFRFPLDSLLQFRRSMEQQREFKLHAATLQVSKMRHRIENVRKQTEALKRQLAQSLETGTTSAELQLLRDVIAGYGCQSEQLQQELLRLENVRNEEMAHYRDERRNREILENLRTHSLEEYRRNLSRREQQRTDDLFLMRHTRDRRG